MVTRFIAIKILCTSDLQTLLYTPFRHFTQSNGFLIIIISSRTFNFSTQPTKAKDLYSKTFCYTDNYNYICISKRL